MGISQPQNLRTPPIERLRPYGIRVSLPVGDPFRKLLGPDWQREYHWHKHDRDDEFFFVLEGHFIIDLEDRSIDLQPQQGFVVPRGVMHRTRAPERAVILMAETAAIVPTGDA